MICSNTTSAHDGLDVARVLVRGTTFRAVMCRGCRERYCEMGLPVIVDQRSDPARPDRGRLSLFGRNAA